MNTGNYTKLELFAKALPPGGIIRLESTDGKLQEFPVQGPYYQWLKIPVEKHTGYQLSCEKCQISLCYLSGCENILEEGVRYLEQEPGSGSFAAPQKASQYNSPIRETYHFSPWKNWLNDPNGLCWFQGYYHMFYQLNPHSQKWSHMYWGHAASKDLVHWTHLPVVLEPQEEILANPLELSGGAFSGSAIVNGDEAIFFLTRSSGPSIDGIQTVQQQWMMKSSDMLHFTDEELIIGEPPQGASFDFRDPKVIRADGRWYMVLGSALNGKAAILLYESGDLRQWDYKGPLLTEQETGIRCFECPDIMELDGKYVVTGALMHHYDPCGRYQMCRYYIGNFKDSIFTQESQGWFDFGGNCYAMQSFCHEGRRINIGWVSDFYGEHLELENGACGSMTLPREMHVKDGKLYLSPVKELECLKREVLYQGHGDTICLHSITPNAYKAELEFLGNIHFSIQLAEHGSARMLLIHDGNGLRLEMQGVKSARATFPADIEKVEKLEIFTDRRTTEIYVNGGEAVGTKLFYDTSDSGCFLLHTDTPEGIKKAEIFRMESIWEK